MKVWRIAAGVSCCLSLVAGCCNMCQDPYIDCGPVWSRGASLKCNPDYRAGSILNRPEAGALPVQGPARTAQPVPQAYSLGTVNPPSTVTTAPVE